MKKSKNFSSKEKQVAIIELQKAMKENKDLRMHERYQVILLIFQGKTKHEISSITGRSEATIHNYSRAYREASLEDLVRKNSP